MDIHDAEIADRLDAAIGDGPAHRPIEDRLRAGRSAVRRRRAVAGAGALALAVVIGGTAWWAAPGGDPQRTEDDPSLVAVDPDGGTTHPGDRIVYETRTANAQEAAEMKALDEFLVFDDSETLVVHRDYTFVRRIDDYLSNEIPSVAAVLRKPGGRLVEIFLTTQGSSYREVASSTQFEAWVADVARDFLADLEDDAEGDESMPDTVDGSVFVEITGPDAPLRAVGGATILEQQTSPDIAENFAKPGDPSWAAHVSDADGAEWFVLVRRVPGSDDYFALPVQEVSPPATFAHFLDWARQRYESEVGVR